MFLLQREEMHRYKNWLEVQPDSPICEPCINDESSEGLKIKVHQYGEPRRRNNPHRRWGTLWVNPMASHTALSSAPGFWFCSFECACIFCLVSVCVCVCISIWVDIKYVQVPVCTGRWKTTVEMCLPLSLTTDISGQGLLIDSRTHWFGSSSYPGCSGYHLDPVLSLGIVEGPPCLPCMDHGDLNSLM